MSRKIKAVIFDMDGVLVDAAPWHYEAFNRSLNIFGYNIGEEEHNFFYNGLPTKVKLEKLHKDKNFPLLLSDTVSELKQIYTMEIIYSRCKPKFHTSYALSHLKKQGYHLVVASNSIRETVKVMMDKSHLSEYLDFILSNQDVEKPKPYPDIYLKAFEYLELSPQECIIVEDSESGIKAAKASGAHVLVVNNTYEVNYENISSFISKIEEEEV